MFSSQNPSS